MELLAELLLQQLNNNSITKPSPWGLPCNRSFEDMLDPTSLASTWLIRGTSCDTVSTEEVRAHAFTDVTVPCHFSFVEVTENLEFSWEKEDIQGEYEVEND